MTPPHIPSPHAIIQDLLDDVRDLDVECLALDYVEQALGRRYFQEHWEKKTNEEHERLIRVWLESVGQDLSLTHDILVELQRLYRVRAQWPR